MIASVPAERADSAGLAPAFAAVRARIGLIALLVGLTALAWWSTVDRMAGMDSGPVRIASATWVGVALVSAGACLPFVSAPPCPTAWWHWAQLVRNSSPP